MIVKILLDAKAVDLNTESGFTYASGKKGPIYCDIRVLLSYPEKRDQIVKAYLNLIKEKGFSFDFVVGVATSAIPWGAIIADKLGKPFVYVRASKKDHGKENQIEGELEEGKRVLVIEDLINSGGSSVSACKALEQESCSVVACVAVFNYGLDIAHKEFTEAKIPLYSLSNFQELLQQAESVNYINSDEKKILLEWHKTGKWKNG